MRVYMQISKIKAAISELPQASRLNHEDFKSWLESVGESDPKRIEWHLKRAAGVGGSDIGVLLLEAQGLTPPFGRTGVQMAGEKLLKIAPSRPLPHMMRGIFLEAPLIEAIINIYGGSRDLFSEQAIANATIPNRNGNCDFYWNLNGQRILVDTKVPVSATELDEMGSDAHKIFSYKAQLNHYDLIAEQQGCKADKMCIAELDIPVELADSWVKILRTNGKAGHEVVVNQMTTLLADETPGMCISFIEVEPDLKINLYGKETPIREAIPQVSDMFMQHLINGEPYLGFTPPAEPLNNESEHLLQASTQRLGSLRAISEYCERESAAVQNHLKEFFTDNPTEFETYKSDFFNIKQTSELNTSTAISTLKKYPIDLDDLRLERDPQKAITFRDIDTAKAIQILTDNGLLDQCLKKPDFDPEKLSAALKAVGESPEFMKESNFTIRKSATKTAKAEYSKLAEFTTDIEEYLSVRQMNAHYANREQEVQEVTSTTAPSSMMKAG